MFLDYLKNFQWYNEPANVCFVEDGMLVETEAQTDFWQSSQHHIHKDNGHFFYTSKISDFSITIKWRLNSVATSDQCGLMLRIDEYNWAKISILNPDIQKIQIGCVVAKNGDSDWSAMPIDLLPQNIWFKAIRRAKDFMFFVSLDGKNYNMMRMFAFPQADDVLKVGAYACSPQNHNFKCILEDIS